MKLLDKLYVIEKMIRLIEWERTGNANHLANTLGISRSQLYIEIEELKSMDVAIRFSRAKNSYVFSGNKTIKVRNPLLIIDRSEQKQINGGQRNKSFPTFYFSRQAQRSIFQ